MTWEEISRELFEKRTAKQWKIIDEEFISYTGGTAQLISNGECEIHLWEIPKDAQLFCDKLNALNEENEQLEEAREYYQENFLTMKTEEQTNSVEEVRKLRGRENKTAKRFELIWETDEMCNVFDNDLDVNSTISVEDVVDLLNKLHEENQLLKLQVETKLFSRRELEKENEQLKKRLAEREKMLDVRDKIIADVMKAVNGDVE